MKSQKEIDDGDELKHYGAKAPDNLNETLKAIQLSLARIEHNKVITSPEPKNYAAAATTAALHNSRNSKLAPAKQALKDKAPTPKETGRAMEITDRIIDEADKERIKALPTKDLVEALQAGTNGIREVSRLISGDIKIHTESLEAKKSLQEQTDWAHRMAVSATVQVRTISVWKTSKLPTSQLQSSTSRLQMLV